MAIAVGVGLIAISLLSLFTYKWLFGVVAMAPSALGSRS